MPRREKARGYSKTSHSVHPGVTISEERRQGRKVLMLRWREPLARGRTGKRKAEVVKNKAGRPVTSRSDARSFAIAKSEALALQRIELANEDASGSGYNPEASWEELAKAHAARLKDKGRRPKSREGYKQSWRFLKRWKGRPAKPRDLTERDLERFVSFVASRRNKRTGERLAPASVASILAHVKVRLAFGRRRMKCVRVDIESMREALAAPNKQRLTPVAHHAEKLRTILDAAAEYDEAHPASTTFPIRAASNTFPLLAFFMVSGCRRGEVEHLRWHQSEPGAAESWVDFEGDRILIYSHKTSRERVLPLETRPRLRALLRLMRDQADVEREPFVFGGPAPLAINSRRDVRTEGKGRSLKRALSVVRKNSGGDWALKSLRSTTATHLCNADLYRGNTYNVASEMGHRHDVLLSKYAKQFALPKDRAKAKSIEGALGIDDAIAAWLKSRAGAGGRVLKLHGRAA